jgi:ArsR family transcriptional regulator, cadmium/lead-responsive transcriptional repressor
VSASSADLDAIARLGRAIADPTRCRILLALAESSTYPAKLAVALGLTRPNVSNHLTCLRGCGLVTAVPEGRQVRYELASPHLAHALYEVLKVVGEIGPGAGEGCGTDIPGGQETADPWELHTTTAQ